MTDAPILSFPAILRNPGLNTRFAHLHGTSTASPPRGSDTTPAKKRQREDREGKRWIRRKDNARFVGNPHVVPAAKKDYALTFPNLHPTFPEPLPSYLPRTVKLPEAPELPTTDPASANAGRFSLSLKGMRRDLRRGGGRAQALVRDIESELVQWLSTGGTVLAPDTVSNTHDATVGVEIGTTGSIFEVSRTPLQLVWRITDDSFARYVVHCCARYHEVVSFSKGDPEQRLTYLLRPNVTRPDRRAPATLQTPPITDIDYSSNPETDNVDSDFVSDRDLDSDIELETKASALTPIEEKSKSTSPTKSEDWLIVEEEDSVGGESDGVDEFESGSEFGSGLDGSIDALQPRLQALAIHREEPEVEDSHSNQDDPDKTITEIQPSVVNTGSMSPRRRQWTTGRSPSSPSLSPVRTRLPRRRMGKKQRIVVGFDSGRSFYEYLFM
ncbi:hypothetical protein CVT24_009958 [Panaeolus cyanescens]|uniref:Uncharacterized protein n=1 Tax=Panaeolus cyanescens TaxID=181874 RepID=A0A409VXH7_9AGAR|nr:hypothetical protein CVT24_009958 [Panaeolus cyanescens]